MNPLYYTIAPEIFARFPGYTRGVVVAYEVANRESPPKLTALLRQAEAGLREKLTIENLTAHPRINAWREAYRAFGAKPSEFRSSIEAMARRALRSEPLPAINALVDIGNLVSLRHLVTVGGHAIDEIAQDIALRLATGSEMFTAFGSDQVESPLPGEVIFAEGDVVLTRRWSWRQANHTLTLPTTRAIEFNVDGLPPVTSTEVEAICQEVTELVSRFCGGRIRHEILSQDNPRIAVR
jgi:DNA/RNA-binding domain of Phe-tRNA-synthetase-like protein